MIKYYEVLITNTSKPVNNSKDNYSIYNSSHKNFKTIKEVKDWLAEIYPKVKKVKMYKDKTDGSSQHIGYIYCFKNKDWSHNSPWYWQRDWIEIREIKATPIII